MRSEYRTQRILGPDDKTGRFVGVGTPFIANHPYTDRNYFVFTGWTSYEGAQREVYAAEIHEDFSLTDIRLVLPWNEPGRETGRNMTLFFPADLTGIVQSPFLW